MSNNQHLRHWREVRAISQTEMAGKLGISQGALASIEGGSRYPSLKLAGVIHRATRGQVPAHCWHDFETTEGVA